MHGDPGHELQLIIEMSTTIFETPFQANGVENGWKFQPGAVTKFGEEYTWVNPVLTNELDMFVAFVAATEIVRFLLPGPVL